MAWNGCSGIASCDQHKATLRVNTSFYEWLPPAMTRSDDAYITSDPTHRRGGVAALTAPAQQPSPAVAASASSPAAKRRQPLLYGGPGGAGGLEQAVRHGGGGAGLRGWRCGVRIIAAEALQGVLAKRRRTGPARSSPH